jgi:hypothetical protein
MAQPNKLVPISRTTEQVDHVAHVQVMEVTSRFRTSPANDTLKNYKHDQQPNSLGKASLESRE